jgi:hypothetical protein
MANTAEDHRTSNGFRLEFWTHTLRHTLTLHITWKRGRLLAGSLPIASTPAPI